MKNTRPAGEQTLCGCLEKEKVGAEIMKTIGELEEVLKKEGILKGYTGSVPAGKPLTGLSWDSRKAKRGDLFICKGAAFRDSYLQEAADRGCDLYIAQHPIFVTKDMGGLIVTDIRKGMAAISGAFFDYRPGSPRLTGITGTKGKTTTAWYLKAMLDFWQEESGGKETGLLSTVMNYDGSKREEAVMTTPEAPVLHQHIANAAREGLSYLTMEVSSQALKYKRVRGLQFDAGIFLNISEDHISPQEHQDFEDYFNSKLAIFRQTKTACVNLDSDFAERILKAARKSDKIITFGRHPRADIRCSQVKTEGGRLAFTVECRQFTEHFSLAMPGKFNIENAVAAIAAATVYGVPVSCMKKALESTKVPGRMETFFSSDKQLCCIVDFAHNRLSFEKLYDAAYQEYRSYKKIITVFGCPGGKALNRRRELGILAGLFSDYVFLTSDDPGTETVEQICDELKSYVEMTDCPCGCVPDRETAIRLAVQKGREFGERTLILFLGRGTERCQRIGNRLIPGRTDSEMVQEALERQP